MDDVIHTPAQSPPIPVGWRWSRLQDVCAVFDCPHSTPQVSAAGPYLIARSQDIRAGTFAVDRAAHVSEPIYRERTARAVPSPGDLLFSREGTYFGIAAEVPQNANVCLGQRMVLLRPLPGTLDFRFLRYWLNSPVMVRHMHGLRDGSVAERLNVPTIKSLPVLLPPFHEQQVIARSLFVFDQKIELNHRMNDMLETIARSVFGMMFGSGDARSQDVPFSEVADISRDSVSPEGFPTEIFEHYSIPAFDDGRVPAREGGERIKSNKFIVSDGCVLLSKLNPRIPRVWLPALARGNRSICSTEFLVLRPRPGFSPEFIYGLCCSNAFQESFAAMVTGTSGSHQRVKPEYLEKMAIDRPEPEKVGRFTLLAHPLQTKVTHNLQESSTLKAVRDALLPKLISGEIRVRDAGTVTGAI